MQVCLLMGIVYDTLNRLLFKLFSGVNFGHKKICNRELETTELFYNAWVFFVFVKKKIQNNCSWKFCFLICYKGNKFEYN